MEEFRQDYVPKSWKPYSMNRWMAARPQRMLVWFALLMLVAIGIVVWAIADARHFFGNVRDIVLLVAAVVMLVQVAIYTPRAVRAARQR